MISTIFSRISWLLLKLSLSFTLVCCLGEALAQDNEETDDALSGSTVNSVARDKPFKFFTFTLENDLFVGEDDGYTNGIGISFGRGPFLEFSRENLPLHLHWLSKNLYISKMPNKARGVAHMFFQQMQTPEDITIRELQVDDIPYVGFTAVQSALFAWDKDRSDQLSLFLGVVGPIALGEEAQKFVHSVVGAEEPLGWDNQIENEFVFRVQARQTRKFARNYSGRFGYDVLGLGEVSLGTIQSDVAAGLAVRWGTNLEFSHATFNLQADRQVNALALSDRNNFFVYLGALAGYVANDILIDGNTFEDSHSVGLEHARNQIATGIVWKRKSLAYVFQLSSFSGRSTISSSRDNFGAFSITYPFK